MAILNISGAESGVLAAEGCFSGGTVSVDGTTKSTGSYSFRTNPTTTNTGYAVFYNALRATLGIAASGGTVYVRVYFYWHTKPGSASETFMVGTAQAVDGAPQTVTTKWELRLNSDTTPKILFYTGDGTLVATSTATLAQDTWHLIEVKVVHGASGSCEVKINGTSDISVGSGVNTNWSANALSGIVLGKPYNLNGQTVDFYFDDLSISDSAYPGAGQCVILVPTGTGNYTAWTGDNTAVDEIPASSADFINTSTLNNAETDAMQNASVQSISGTINAVKSLCHIARNSTSATAVAVRLRSATTDNDTSDYATANGTYWGVGKIYETDPATSAAWNTSGIDGVEVGVVHHQSQAREARCAAIYMLVDFTPAATANAPGLRETLYAVTRASYF